MSLFLLGRRHIWCRPVAILLIVLCAATLPGCQVEKTRKLLPAEIRDPQTETIVGVTTTDGRAISFDDPGARIRDQRLLAETDGTPVDLPLSEVQRFWVLRKETSTWRTAGLIAGAVGALVLTIGIVALTKNSCPFVYSWDGERFVFDAEPYGGAITRGLERDDISELQQLRAVDGRYRLLIRNEVPETQYTDMMQLLVIDHPLETRVLPDQRGTFHAVDRLIAPVSAVNRSGTDLRPWLLNTDRLIWEETPSATGDRSGSPLRDEIILTFPKPAEVKQARLVTNLATGLWGSYMIREILALRGEGLDAWYQQIDSSPQAAELVHAWGRWTETYALNVDILQNGGWKTAGALLGEGPFNAEDRIILLDVSQVEGNHLKIRLRPPLGFWAFNSFAVDYSSSQAIEKTEILPSRARDSHNRDLLTSLAAVDGDYYVMPRVGDLALIEFPAPKRLPCRRRTIFLYSRGYYRLHLEGSGRAQHASLQQLETNPDFVIRMAFDRFDRWSDRYGLHAPKVSE